MEAQGGADKSAGRTDGSAEWMEAQGSIERKGTEMANKISDETIEYVGILAKLELSETEKEQAKKDMEQMLDYIDKLNELDTSGIEPMSHIFPVNNVFREDVVTNADERESLMENAPAAKEGQFKVPKTV